MNLLLIRLIPFSDESFNSFISRTAEVNFMTIQDLYKLADLIGKRSYYSIYSLNPKKLEKLSHLTEIPIHDLVSMCSFNEEHRNDVIGLQFKLAIHTKKQKICPECFKKNRYIKKEWDLALLTVCPIHQCMLIDNCLNCQQYIRIHRKNFHRCDCGFNLLKSPIIPVSENESMLSKIIYSKANSEFKVNIMAGVPILNLNLHELVRVLMFMAKFIEVNGENYRFRSLMASKTMNLVVHVLMNQVLKIFLNWPFNFYSFLDNFPSHFQKTNLGGISSHFGNFYLGMNSEFNNESFHFFIKAFHAYISNSPRRRYQPLHKRIEEDSDFISVNEVKNMIGGHPKTIRKLVDENKLEGITKQIGGRNYLLIKRSSLEAYRVYQNNLISLSDAMPILKINRSYVKKFIDKGLIVGEFTNGKYLIYKPSIDALLSKLDDKANYVKSDHGFIPLKNAANFGQLVERLNSNLFDLIQWILDDQLKLFRRDGQGLERYFFQKDELKCFFRSVKKVL